LSATGTGEKAASTAKEVATVATIYPGNEPVGLNPVLTEINKKMGSDIGVNLKLTWAPWDQYQSKIELAVSAGEQIDWIWLGSSDMQTLASKKLIVPIDDMLAKYGSLLYKTIDKSMFDTMKLDGKVMGFPAAGNMPKRDVFQVLLYRDDLRLKYKLPPLTSIENVEKFFDTVKANEPGMTPLASKSTAYRIMKAFGEGGFLGGTNGAAGYELVGGKAAKVYPIQDLPAWKGAVAKAREWYLKGYLPKDILNIDDETALLKAGTAAAVSGSAMTAAENQGTVSQVLPGAVLAEAVVELPTRVKYVSGNGGNAFYLSAVSKQPDAVLKFWAWPISSQANYDLYCFGILGKNYQIDNGRIKYLNSDYTDFPSWMFKNIVWYRYPVGLTDSYIQTIKDWDKGSVPDPMASFIFDPKDVSAELAAFSAVWGQYTNALSTGTLDNLADVNAKFKAAGQDKIVAAAQKQLDAYFAGK
jgi:putative aldouronate transport system substrate-binding protein